MACFTAIWIRLLRRKLYGKETYSRQKTLVQILRKLARMDPRSAEYLEWSICTTTDGDVGRFYQPQSGIERCFFQITQIWRRIDPRQPCRIVPVAALPSLHSDYGQGRVQIVLLVEVTRQLTHRHAVAHGQRHVVDVTLGVIGDWPLYKWSVDRIGAVEHNDLCSRLSCGFEEIRHRSFIGVVADTRILQINHDGIELAQHLRRRPPLLFCCAVKAYDRNPRLRIG